MANSKNVSQKSGKNILAWIGGILAVVIVIGLCAFNALRGSGVVLRSKTAAESENYKFSGTMMAYAAGSTYQNFASAFQSMGIDLNVSLKDQVLPYSTGEDTMSCFDYVMNYTKTSVSEILALCEYAKANGIELDDADKESARANLDSITESAASYGYPSANSFIKAAFGNGVNEKDAVKFYELYTLASKAAAAFYENNEVTPEDREAYYAEHPEEFDGVDFYTYTVKLASEDSETAEDEETATESEEGADVLEAIAFAQTLATATDSDAFKTMVREYEASLNPDADEETLNEKVENTFRKHVLASSVSDEEISEWLFSANEGEVKLFTDEDNGAYTVILLDKKAYRDETLNRSVRHILLAVDEENEDDDTKAKEILAQLEEANFSEEKWNELAAEYSTDAGSKDNGGLYESVVEGETMTEFNDWLFDADRKEGDSGIVKTSAGWHVMYYVGESEDSAWMSTADTSIVGERYEAVIEENSTGITYNDDVVNSISLN